MPSLEFIHSIYALKDVLRRGWLFCGIPEKSCESVAEHTYSTALLALLYLQENKDAGLDGERVLTMALVHDLIEAKIGDITPRDGIAGDKREALENLAAESLLAEYPELESSFREFRDSNTVEARLVRELDILDRAIQSIIYRHTGGNEDELDRFIEEGFEKLQNPWVFGVFLKVLEHSRE